MVNHLRLGFPIKFSSGFIFTYHVEWVVGGMVVTTTTYYYVWNHFRADLTLPPPPYIVLYCRECTWNDPPHKSSLHWQEQESHSSWTDTEILLHRS